MASSSLLPCDVHHCLGDDVSACHSTSYSKKQGMMSVDELNANEKALLMHRIGTQDVIVNICFHHKVTFLDYFEKLEKACCDPWNCHKISCRKSLRTIDMDLAIYLTNQVHKTIKAGQKLCPSCRKKSSPPDVEIEDEIQDALYSTTETNSDTLSAGFKALGCPPVKVSRVGDRDRCSYVKRTCS